MDKGYIHFYTGNGKGKTTTALGLALRAAGSGKKVFIGQFVKGLPYGELEALRLIPAITLKQFGRECFIKHEPTEEDRAAARQGWVEVSELILNHRYDVVILDEIFIALHYHLIQPDEVMYLLQHKPMPIELILTGRYAPAELFPYADLITEMKEIKHYYQQGVMARKGIEY